MYMCAVSDNTNASFRALDGISLEELKMTMLSDSTALTTIADMTMLGSPDGPSNGILGSPQAAVVDALLGGQMRFEETTIPHDFVKYAPDLFYIGLVHTGLVNPILTALMDGPPSRDGFDIVMSIHYLVRHWSEDLHMVWEDVYTGTITSAAGSIESSLFGPPIAFLVVALAAAVTLLYLIYRIDRGLHFALSTLSAVNPDVIMESIPLTNFLVGIFPTNERAVALESALRNAVAHVTSEVTLQLQPDGVVKEVNAAIEQRWGVRASDCLDIDLSLILEFDASVTNPLTTNLNTTITLVKGHMTIPVNSYVFEVRTDRVITAYVMFMEDLRERNGLLASIEAESEKARELVVMVIPRSLNGKMTETNQTLTYVSDWVAVICVQLCDFNEVARHADAVEIVKHFRMDIDMRLEQMTDISRVNSVGLSDYLLVNGGGIYQDEAAAIPGIWQACNSVMEAGARLGLQLQFGVCGESQVVMGLASTDNLSFNIFGRVLKTARALARKASSDSLVVEKTSFPMFSEAVECPGKPVAFKVGQLSYLAEAFQLGRSAGFGDN
jgi:hypothetical protein